MYAASRSLKTFLMNTAPKSHTTTQEPSWISYGALWQRPPITHQWPPVALNDSWDPNDPQITPRIQKMIYAVLSKTLPEAQRTQGIESLTWITLLTKLNLYQFQITQVLDSIAWVHCATTWIWPPDGATCIDYKFSHQVASLASVAILATRCAPSISWESGHHL